MPTTAGPAARLLPATTTKVTGLAALGAPGCRSAGVLGSCHMCDMSADNFSHNGGLCEKFSLIMSHNSR